MVVGLSLLIVVIDAGGGVVGHHCIVNAGWGPSSSGCIVDAGGVVVVGH